MINWYSYIEVFVVAFPQCRLAFVALTSWAAIITYFDNCVKEQLYRGINNSVILKNCIHLNTSFYLTRSDDVKTKMHILLMYYNKVF